MPVPVRVECYAGYQADEIPLRFYLGTKKIEVLEILARWYSPEHAGFRVRAGDGLDYVLRHDRFNDAWLAEPVA
jgi:hypothetical protein